MPSDAKPSFTPKLRFPQFRDEPGWNTAPGDQLFEQINSRQAPSGLPILAITQEHGAIPRDAIDYHVAVTEKSVETYKEVRPGDFIISLRSFQGGIEYSEYHGICSPAYVILRKKADLSDLFFKHLFKSHSFIQRLTKNLEGLRDGKMISYTQFSELQLPLPSKIEQQKIAECLSTLDELIAAESQKLDLLKAHKKGLMQQLFPRAGETIPRIRFAEFRNAGDWVVKPLVAIAPLQRGFDLPASEIRSGIVPIVYSNGPKGFHERGMAKGPGVVTGRSGTIGKIHFIEHGDYWPHNTSLWVTSFEGHFPKFVFYLYESIGFERFASGSGVPTLNRNEAHSFTVGIPLDIEEQQRIATCLSSLDDLIVAQSDKVETLKTHKKGLIQQLFPSPPEGQA